MKRSKTAPPLPTVFIGPANAVAVCGEPWPRIRDRARRMGVRTLKAGKTVLVPLADYIEALESLNAEPGREAEPLTPRDELARRLDAEARRERGR